MSQRPQPRSSHPMALARGVALGVLLLGCSEEPAAEAPAPGDPVVEESGPSSPADVDPILDPTPPGAERNQRILDIGAGTSGGATLMVHGEAELHLRIQGQGRMRFGFERDREQRDSLAIPIDSPDKIVRRKVPVPGTGSRAVRIRWAQEGELDWKRLSLRDQIPALPPGPDAELRGRSVVLIVADALSAASLSCYGNPRETSPTLDRLADEGARFEVVYSQTAWTVPSVCSIFTGLEQEQHGVLNVGQMLPEQFPTLAGAFANAGYETAAFVQNGLVNRDAALDRGFELFHDGSGPRREQMHQAILDWVAEDHDRPFFLYLHLLPPHSPYTPPEPFLSRFGGVSGSIDGSVPSINRVCANNPRPEHPAVECLRRLYDAHVAYMDSLIAEMLEALRSVREDEELLLVFTSDHGEAMAQHGFVGHNLHVYDDMVRVPLVMWAPGAGFSRGQVLPQPTSLLDVYPTLAEMCGIGGPDGGPGHSLAGLLQGLPAPTSRFFHLSARYTKSGPEDEVHALQLGVLAGHFKLVQNHRGRQSMLYDLSQDPDEILGVQGRFPVLLEALKNELETWTEESRARQDVDRFVPDARMKAELEALGYLPTGNGKDPDDKKEDDTEEDDTEDGA